MVKKMTEQPLGHPEQATPVEGRTHEDVRITTLPPQLYAAGARSETIPNKPVRRTDSIKNSKKYWLSGGRYGRYPENRSC